MARVQEIEIAAEMVANVLSVEVAEGDSVAVGDTVVLLETTAGQGSCLGNRFEHLARLFELVPHHERLGVCVDTCHIFAAGYDIRTPETYAATFAELERVVGLGRVRCLHLNDSQKGLGSRVDRHEHIGLGTIGDDGFRPIMRDKRWRDTPKILETPKLKHEDGRDWDTVNLERLKSLSRP